MLHDARRALLRFLLPSVRVHEREMLRAAAIMNNMPLYHERAGVSQDAFTPCCHCLMPLRIPCYHTISYRASLARMPAAAL